MGMFDDVKCSYLLPDPAAQEIHFQTKDLDCTMSQYEITAEGRLVEHCWKWERTPVAELPDPTMPSFGVFRRVKDSHTLRDLDYHGDLNFYGSIHTGQLRRIRLETGIDEAHPGPEPEYFDYVARFTDGVSTRITRLPND